MVDPAPALPLPVDPDGLDTEGLSPADDGGFWIAEEYVPSLLRLTADGRMVRRIVPIGAVLGDASRHQGRDRRLQRADHDDHRVGLGPVVVVIGRPVLHPAHTGRHRPMPGD
jgi:hypothetical protein